MSAYDAKTHFGKLLDRVARGDEVVITRYDKPVARLIPEGRPDKRQAAAAVAGLRELQAEIGAEAALSDDEVRSAIEEGQA